MRSLRSRPTGTSSVPVTAAGVSARSVASRWFGTTFTHSLACGEQLSISSSGRSRLSLIVRRLAVAAHGADAHA